MNENKSVNVSKLFLVMVVGSLAQTRWAGEVCFAYVTMLGVWPCEFF